MKKLTYCSPRTFYTRNSFPKRIYKYGEAPKDIPTNSPSCKSQDLNDHYNMDRYGFNVHSSCRSNCGLNFVNPRINYDSYDRLYMDGFYRGIIDTGSVKKQNRLNEVPKRLEIALSNILEMYKDDELDVLDIGGAEGIFNYLDENLKIRKYVCAKLGVEEADNNGCNAEVAIATIEEFEVGDQKYNLIFLIGAISDLMNPYEAFFKSRDLLKDDGLFVSDFKDSLTRMKAVNLPFIH